VEIIAAVPEEHKASLLPQLKVRTVYNMDESLSIKQMVLALATPPLSLSCA